MVLSRTMLHRYKILTWKYTNHIDFFQLKHSIMCIYIVHAYTYVKPILWLLLQSHLHSGVGCFFLFRRTIASSYHSFDICFIYFLSFVRSFVCPLAPALTSPIRKREKKNHSKVNKYAFYFDVTFNFTAI